MGLHDKLATEEATKNALIMPFIAALGYDVFDPTEVVPELVADVGIKKGEKVDYAVKRDGEVIILFEAKKAGEELSRAHSSQLFRYFTVTHARIAVLTNGVRYQFYTDLEEPNKMDERPFLEIDLCDLREDHVQELQKLSKEQFDLQTMLSRASDLKYLSEIRKALERQFGDPDEEFVRWLFGLANPTGRFVQSAKESFTVLVRTALGQVIRDRVTDRLRSALQHGAANDTQATPSQAPVALPEPTAVAAVVAAGTDAPSDDKGVVTTEDEILGYQIVRAIVCSEIGIEPVFYRDAQSYFSVLLDDNNREPPSRAYDH